MKVLSGWLLALACGLVVVSGAAQAQRPRPTELDRIVAVVNDDVITRGELNRRSAQVARQLQKQGTALPSEDVLEKQLLERMVVDRVQLQMAKESGIRVDDGQLEMAFNRIAEANKMTLPQFREALEKDGITWSRFRDEIRDEMTITRLREREVDNKVSVSDGEIDNYLATNRSNEEFLVQHILLRIPERASPEQLQRLQLRATQAAEAIGQGADFAQTAAGFSDATDAMNGGSIGWRSLDRLPSLYAEAVANMKQGQVSGILRSPAGFHIVRLMDRRGNATVTQKIQQSHARHILIKTSELVSESEARHKLEVLRERLTHGGDFAELARLHSNDLSSAKGGDLGWVYPGDTVPEFEKTMDGLKIGEISQPVQSPFGFHLIQVLERRVDDVSQERQRLTARSALRERKMDEAYQDWLRQIRDRAYVEYRRD